MSLRDLTTDELVTLRQKINIELALRRHRERSVQAAIKIVRGDIHYPMPDSVKTLVHEVATRRELRPEILLSKTQVAPVAQARWEVWAALRERGFSYPRIGSWFHRNHATIIHGVRRHNEMLAKMDIAA